MRNPGKPLKRIKSLSDAALLRYYGLLSNTDLIVNVPSLGRIEAELRSRGLRPPAKPSSREPR